MSKKEKDIRKIPGYLKESVGLGDMMGRIEACKELDHKDIESGKAVKCDCGRLAYKIGVTERRYYKYYCKHCYKVIERLKKNK